MKQGDAVESHLRNALNARGINGRVSVDYTDPEEPGKAVVTVLSLSSKFNEDTKATISNEVDRVCNEHAVFDFEVNFG